jgi:hypothetical protein
MMGLPGKAPTMPWKRTAAVVLALAVATIGLAGSPAFADNHTTYNPVPMTKCSGTNAPGNTTTITLPNGGEITVLVDNCVSRDAVTHLYSFWSTLSWTDTDNDRGSTPFNSFLLTPRRATTRWCGPAGTVPSPPS